MRENPRIAFFYKETHAFISVYGKISAGKVHILSFERREV